VNGDASKAAGLVANVQKMVDERQDKGLKTFVVFMGGPELKEPIEKVAKERKITIPLVFLPKGTGEGDIGAYKINPASHNTVLLWKQGTVQNNFVDVDGKSMAAVQKAVDAMLQ
jgi:hypothetical protein